MSSLKRQLRQELNEARRARERIRTELLTTTLSEIRNREIELNRELADEDAIQVISRAVRQRQEAARQMREGGRTDLAEKEEREEALLQVYLPEALDENEVRQLIRVTISNGADNIGAVMKAVMPKLKGRFDGGEANRIVREELGG